MQYAEMKADALGVRLASNDGSREKRMREAVRHCLDHFSVGQSQYFVRISIESANNLRIERDLNHNHAANLVPKRITNLCEKAKREGWNVRHEHRDASLPQCLLSSMLYSPAILNACDRGFLSPIPAMWTHEVAPVRFRERDAPEGVYCPACGVTEVLLMMWGDELRMRCNTCDTTTVFDRRHDYGDFKQEGPTIVGHAHNLNDIPPDDDIDF